MVMPRSSFEIHGIQQLLFHVSISYGAGPVEKPIRKRRFPMVDMGNNTKIPDMC
jgi:hypothetical protein